jgi:hypothetical protein
VPGSDLADKREGANVLCVDRHGKGVVDVLAHATLVFHADRVACILSALVVAGFGWLR